MFHCYFVLQKLVFQFVSCNLLIYFTPTAHFSKVRYFKTNLLILTLKKFKMFWANIHYLIRLAIYSNSFVMLQRWKWISWAIFRKRKRKKSSIRWKASWITHKNVRKSAYVEIEIWNLFFTNVIYIYYQCEPYRYYK